MKQRIDIEKLVQWAMREELPKGKGVSATPWSLLMRYASLGVRVDTSSPGDYDPLGYVPGEPDADALIVGEAVRALDDDAQIADEVEARALFGEWQGIADDAARALTRAFFKPRSLVITHAVMGNRPQWKFDQPVARPVEAMLRNARNELRSSITVLGVDALGELTALKRNRGKAFATRGEYDLDKAPRSPLRWCFPMLDDDDAPRDCFGDAMITIGEARAEYVAWHHALTTLARDLDGVLDRYVVRPPAISRTPWIDGEPVQIIHHVGDHGTAILPESPARYAPTRGRRRTGRTLTIEEMAVLRG